MKKPISKLIFAGYTGSKNAVQNRLKTQFVKLDFSNLMLIKCRSVGGYLAAGTKKTGDPWPMFVIFGSGKN